MASRKTQLENQASETDYMRQTLSGVPMTIYVG